MSKTKPPDKIPQRSTFQLIKYISIAFLWENFLAEILLTHAEEKWLCRISSFYEKRKTK